MKRQADDHELFDDEMKKQQKTEENLSIINAVLTNKSVEDIQKIIDTGDFNLEEKHDGKTPLMHAVLNNNLHVARLLLSAGADVKVEDYECKTVLMLAALHTTDLDFIKNVIKKRYNVRTKNFYGYTPLSLVCRKVDPNPQVIQVLLKHGAKVSDLDQYGNTPLILATQQDSLIIMKLLLNAGAKVDDKNFTGETALFHVQSANSVQLLLKSGANPQAKNRIGNSVIVHLVNTISAETLLDYLQFLLKAGADPSSRDIRGSSIFMLIFKNMNTVKEIEIANLLLRFGVNPSRMNNIGQCALSQAISAQNIEIIKFLIEIGANPSTRLTNRYPTLLMQVCEQNWSSPQSSVQVLLLLIKAGANVSEREVKSCKTALMCAVRSGNLDLVKCLLAAGANPTEEFNNDDYSVLNEAVKSKPINYELVDILVSRSVNTMVLSSTDLPGKLSTLIYALKCNRNDILERLFNYPDYDVNAQNSYGETLLMKTCMSDEENVEVVIFLMRKGAFLSAQDRFGKSALMYALEKQHILIFKMLLNAGAKITTQDYDGNTLLMVACKMGNLEIVEMLLKNNVNPQIINNNGETAAIITASKNHLDILCVLLRHGISVVNKDKNNNSVISYIVKNQMVNEQIHPDLQEVLKYIIHFKTDDVMIVTEVVQIYLENCSKYRELFLKLFQEFTQKVIETVSKKIAYKFILYAPIYQVTEIFTSILGHSEKQRQQSMNQAVAVDFYNRKELFYMILNSKFRIVTWCTGVCLILNRIYDNMLEHLRFQLETMGYLIQLHHEENGRKIDEDSYNFYSNLFKELTSSGFPLNNPTILSPLSVLVALPSENNADKMKESFILKLAKELIDLGVVICQQLITFNDPGLQLLKNVLELPDALWLAFQCGYTSLLPVLIPYWSAHPLVLLMFLPQTTRVLLLPADGDRYVYRLNIPSPTVLSDIFDVLAEISGPLPPGNEYIPQIQNYLDSRHTSPYSLEIVANKFRSLHADNPPSLRQLCRCVIRNDAESGDDLPEHMSSLVPFGLRKFMTLTE